MTVTANPTSDPTALDFINLFERQSGTHAGVRKAHAKGICLSGTFTPESNNYSDSPIFTEESKILLRFSLGGGNPSLSDNAGGPRGAAVRFFASDGSVHNIAGLTVPLFAGSTPADFFTLLELSEPGPDGTVDQQALSEYVASVPAIAARSVWMATHNAPSSYASANYYGVHTFFFMKGDKRQKFRWTLLPDGGERLLEDGESLTDDQYRTELETALASDYIEFNWEAQIGTDEDTDVDPGQLWPEERPRINLGKMTIQSFADNQCDAFTFDPVQVTSGFAISDDPVLMMRSAAYAISYGKRLSGN
ncbi:catalase [uncultured Umboniibacter sp.]|uniref:catalase n=1 Tax=uncultured Umboniibacter sp. TaxID=1798917 RepID=UPI0026141956|nr:catalase [uncultured Umboniibacter sp.]